jgi:HEAT repeat protein
VLDPPQYRPKPKYDENTAKLFAKLRRKKTELLETLGGPDKAQRKKAVAELAGFSFDDKVRAALEKILLSDPDAELRKEAVRSFGKVKNRRAVPALEKASKEDADLQVRDEARKAIKKIRGY